MVLARNYGRMGNVLFQVACAIAYSLKHKIEFSVPTKTSDHFWNPLYLQHLVNPKWQEGREDILLNENGHQYQEIPFNEEWRDLQIVLNGYYQSEKYFKEYWPQIQYLFDFAWGMKPNIISVHVRRGDYLHLTQKHPPVTVEWFEQAMSMFPDKQFKFFSDDIKWCRETFGGRNNISFSTNTNETDDLIEMSCCESQICSASTFSWWGAYLNRNPNKVIIIPELWFTPGWDGLDTSDIVPPEWIKL